MKNILLVITLLISSVSFGQYYYNDIADAHTLGERFKNYISQKVKTITATGYDDRGSRSTDFNEWQEIDARNKILKISTRNGQLVKRQNYQFDDQSRLQVIVDSAKDIRSDTRYSYDGNSNIISIITTTKDSLNDFTQSVAHYYQYNTAGKPVKLWRVINGTDSAEYRFSTDEKGNVTDEQLFRRGVSMDLIYYYYNDQNKVSDIVRYDKKTKKLLPTVMFEYDEAGRLIQKMSVLSTNRPDYIIWRYIFNEKGLKTREALFNKQKELTGRIEFAYTFEN